MGSLRTPIGPLPSSIYWRRRAVAVCILVLLALLAYWAVSLTGGDGGGGDSAGPGKGGGPVESITPGPSASRSLPDDRPGGRDEADGGASGSSGGPSGDDGSAAGGTAGGDGSSTGGGSAGSASGGSSGGGGGGTLTGGDGVPAGSGIPGCRAKSVTTTLKSKENSYEPGDKPVLTLTLHNDTGSDCVVDLGRTGTAVTITGSDDETVWASGDCPQGDAHAWVRVSAHDSSTHRITWDRRRSDKDCATPSPKRAPAGTYLAEIAVDGLHTARTSFVLAES